MKADRTRLSICLASMAFGAASVLLVAPASAQQRSLKDIDCQPSMLALVQGGVQPPPGNTRAEFEYCVGWPFQDPSVPTRLSVRPREMATRTRTDRAGDFQLDSLPNYLVYVPQQCVGAKRCPLVVFLHWGAVDANEVMKWQRPVADKYGMIVLAPTAPNQGWNSVEEPNNRKNVDAALKQVLQKFAIDPDKIALIGHCQSGPTSLIWGGHNLDVFSRIVPISSGYPPTAGVDPPKKTTEFFLDAGFLETAGNFRAARELRQAGHRLKLVVGLRGHASKAENFDFLGRWLRESWTTPTPAARTAPSIVADPVPALTIEALTQMTTFWTSFQREPDSIRVTARQAHLREVLVPVGEERPSAVMVNMPELAAKYPSVAAALTTAGLTAQQHEAYRVAMLSAQVAQDVGREVDLVEVPSALAKNIEFMNAHPDEFDALAATEIWSTP